MRVKSTPTETRPGRKSFQQSFRAATSSGLIFGTSRVVVCEGVADKQTKKKERLGFPKKPLAEMSKTYQIPLFTYKDLCS